MEMPQIVVLTETGALQLTSLTRHVLYHTVHALLPKHSMNTVLPKSGSRKIDNFISDLPQAILLKTPRKKTSLTESLLNNQNQLVPSIEIHRFLDYATSIADFTLTLERQLLDFSGGELDPEKLHEICWNVYESERKADISIPQWFSSTCTFRLWLVFCCVQEQSLDDMLSATTANEVIKRLVELCGYTWNESYRYDESDFLDFPQYLRAIASYFTRLKLETSLTCEVISDMVDEIVHGVLKKGYLIKKGHKRKNWKRRWFVLQRSIMKYFETRENMVFKGQLILNSKTDVKGLPDAGKKRCLFEVTCGHTGTPFVIYADDQRTKHEWMLAIKKAIALAKVLDGSVKDDYSEHLTGFYLLKYGTPQPALSRQDSTVRSMKYHATLKEQRKRLSGKKQGTRDRVIGKPRSSSAGEESECSQLSPPDEYMEMSPLKYGVGDDDTSSDDSSDSYTSMTPLPVEDGRTMFRSHSCDRLLDDDSCNTKNVTALTKSMTVSHSRKTSQEEQAPSLTKVENDRIHSSHSLSVQNPYSPDPSKLMGGYIDVTKVKGRGTVERKVHSQSLPTHFGGFGDEDEGLLTARMVQLGVTPEEQEEEREVEESELRPHPRAENQYLTIIRDDRDLSPPAPPPVAPKPANPTRLPAVPVHKKSLIPDCNDADDEAPPPPPRTARHRESSVPLELVSPTEDPISPQHGYRRSHSSSAAQRHGTRTDGAPPLPPR